MSSKKTPLVGAMGVFEVKAPFEVASDRVYVCEAVRSFTDLYQKNIDVFDVFYKPNNLDKTAFDNDKKVSANIITLITDDVDGGKEVIYIPDTYINAYPTIDGVTYNRVVLSVDFSLLPEVVSLDDIKSRIGTIGSDIIGKVPDVNVHIAPYRGHISDSEHEALESSRRANINYQETDRALYLKERSKNKDLIERLKTAEQILIDNNLI